jgi:hypothetical protein
LPYIGGLRFQILRKFIGRFIAQTTMRSFSIVKASIVFDDDDAGFGDGKEDFLVKALVSKAAMETFNESVLPGTARLNIQRLDVGSMTPILNDVGDKFRAIIRANIRWSPL